MYSIHLVLSRTYCIGYCMHCIVLYYGLYCMVLYWALCEIGLFCIVPGLVCIALSFNVLYGVLYCLVLYCVVLVLCIVACVVFICIVCVSVSMFVFLSASVYPTRPQDKTIYDTRQHKTIQSTIQAETRQGKTGNDNT